jgi:hypothetical protein
VVFAWNPSNGCKKIHQHACKCLTTSYSEKKTKGNKRKKHSILQYFLIFMA